MNTLTSTEDARISAKYVSAEQALSLVRPGNRIFFLNATTNMAEVAYMVAHDWQGVGLGSALKRRLQEYATSAMCVVS